MSIRKRIGLFFLCLLLPLFSLAEGEDMPSPRMRALLIGCDYFVTQENTWPAADNNLQLLSNTLLQDGRSYQLIRSISGRIATVAAFEEAVAAAFSGAREGDTSLLYISTHGVFDEGTSNASAALILSDGVTEERLEAPALEEIMNRIPGKKVLILDACNSGAFIGKGLSGGAARVFFSGPDYKVLCSAGGSEASWYWHGTEDAQSSGASYFATVLANALGAWGDHAADANKDGLITLSETYAFLWDNYAASTPQVYPQNDGEFVLYAYDIHQAAEVQKTITDITFEETLLTAGESEVSFSFTVHRQTELFYQIVYHESGSWQFGIAQHFLDGEQQDGTVLPGRKMRTLSLDTDTMDAYGYAMIQLITIENGRPQFQGARLLCVQPALGDLALSIATGQGFLPAEGQELCIMVRHDRPCGLTVNIQDGMGKTIRRLSYAQPTRPQQLFPAATIFYWDGKNNIGAMMPPGEYTVQVQANLGGKKVICRSEPFLLMEREGQLRETNKISSEKNE